MKILLVDIDSTIPNLALMRLSTWFKDRGHQVDYQHAGVSYYPNRRKHRTVDCTGYNKVYASAVFQGTDKFVGYPGINCFDVTVGGSGTQQLLMTLSSVTGDPAVETAPLDYSLYPDNKTGYGFITRGCPKNCSFCVVPRKEGKLYLADTVDNIVGDFQTVEFLDNNILHYDKHEEILQELIDKKVKCEFNQGLDIMVITDTNAKLLSQLKYTSEYSFAFDNKNYQKKIESKLPVVKKYIPKPWRVRFFIYCHPEMDIETDVYYRIKWCYDNKCLPYLMRDISCWRVENEKLPKLKEQAYVDLAAWCNQPNIFKKMNFKLYQSRRHPKDKTRQRKVGELVCGEEHWKWLKKNAQMESWYKS